MALRPFLYLDYSISYLKLLVKRFGKICTI
nr:MAG TPA: hypothetical protein [Caudoviricetes sp.]